MIDEYAQHDDRAAPVDGERRRAGRRLRLAEVRGPDRRRSARARGHGRSASTRSPTRSRTPTSNLPTGTIYGEKDVRRADQRPADAGRRRTGRRSSPTATAIRSGSKKSRTSTTASRTTGRAAWQRGERCVMICDPEAAGHQRRRGRRSDQGAAADDPGAAAGRDGARHPQRSIGDRFATRFTTSS